MAREKFVRKLQKTGTYSYSLVVPKEIIDTLDWRERQKIVIEFDESRKRAVLRDWKEK